MDYNTKRDKLVLPEYGRCIQDMVHYAMDLDDRSERQRCAFTIIDLMANMQAYNGNEDDFYQKLGTTWPSYQAISSTSTTR